MRASQAVVWDAWYTTYGEVQSITGSAAMNLRFPASSPSSNPGCTVSAVFSPTYLRFAQRNRSKAAGHRFGCWWPLTILVMVGVRLYADEFARLDQRGDDGPALATTVRTGEQGVLAIECNRADGAFDDVGIDLDAAVVDEARQPLPARQCVSDSFCELGLLTDQGEPGAEPGFELIDNRSALLLADDAALADAAATDLAFDRIEPGNAFERSLAIGADPQRRVHRSVGGRESAGKYSAEEKIRIVLEGLRGEENISELCRREGIAASMC